MRPKLVASRQNPRRENTAPGSFAENLNGEDMRMLPGILKNFDELPQLRKPVSCDPSLRYSLA